MNARRIAAVAVFALLVLLVGWHGYWLPPERVPAWFVVLLHALPMWPAAVLFVLGKRSAPFWAALGALITFSHGVTEAWASVPARAPAMIEVILSLLIITAASWNGARARFGRQHKV